MSNIVVEHPDVFLAPSLQSGILGQDGILRSSQDS